MRCNRCDWRGESDEEAEEHAREAGHLRCICCRRRSLTEFEAQTCGACIGAVRADLADIVSEAVKIATDSLTGMTLLGDGTMQRRARPEELSGRRFSALYQQDIPADRHPLMRDGDHFRPVSVRDEWPSDPLPVITALAQWEDMIRADYHDPIGPPVVTARSDDGPPIPVTLTATVDYLTHNLDTGHRIAQTFHAFDEFAAEIRQHHTAIRFAAGLADVPFEAEAECFDCGGPLLRTYRPPVEPVDDGRLGLPIEGLTTELTCAWCRWAYTPGSYMFGLRQKTAMWVPAPVAAKVAHRSVWTVRSWVRRLMVTSACRVEDQAVMVWWPDVSDRAFRHADDECA